MHELGLCDGIVEAAVRRAAGRQVTALRVRIGGHLVDPGVIAEGVEVAAQGTEVAGAHVDVVLDPMRLHCAKCGRDEPVADHLSLIACPGCGSFDIELSGDDQVMLESIAVARADTEPEEARWMPSTC